MESIKLTQKKMQQWTRATVVCTSLWQDHLPLNSKLLIHIGILCMIYNNLGTHIDMYECNNVHIIITILTLTN